MSKHLWQCPTCGEKLMMHVKSQPPTCPHPNRAGHTRPTQMKEKK